MLDGLVSRLMSREEEETVFDDVRRVKLMLCKIEKKKVIGGVVMVDQLVSVMPEVRILQGHGDFEDQGE